MQAGKAACVASRTSCSAAAKEAQPAGGAPLRAAAAREEAHPAYRVDIESSAVM